MRAAATENDGADWHAFGSFPGGVNRGALPGGRGEASIRMRSFGAGFFGDFRGPDVALPVDALGRRLIGHTFPPHAAFGSECNVGENGIFGKRSHRVGVGFDRSSG